MVYPFCSCGSFALDWDADGGQEANAPFPTLGHHESLKSMRCVVVIGGKSGKFSCSFCQEFMRRDRDFREKNSEYGYEIYRRDTQQKKVDVQEQEIRAYKYVVDSGEKHIQEMKDHYKKKCGGDPDAPRPEECSGHFSETVRRSCDGCVGSGYGMDYCKYNECKSGYYPQDRNTKCPRCNYVGYIETPPKRIKEQEARLKMLSRRIEPERERLATLSGKVAERRIALEVEWAGHYQWIEGRVGPFFAEETAQAEPAPDPPRKKHKK